MPANSSPTTSSKTNGTNMRWKRSVNRWVGDFLTSASLTILMTRAKVLSVERRVTSTSMSVSPLMVPAKTFEAASTASGLLRASSASGTGCLSTGTLSPVTGAWLILEEPTTTKPSAGRRSLGRTMTTSPGTSSSTGISTVPFALRTIAVAGASLDSASIAFLARPIA